MGKILRAVDFELLCILMLLLSVTTRGTTTVASSASDTVSATVDQSATTNTIAPTVSDTVSATGGQAASTDTVAQTVSDSASATSGQAASTDTVATTVQPSATASHASNSATVAATPSGSQTLMTTASGVPATTTSSMTGTSVPIAPSTSTYTTTPSATVEPKEEAGNVAKKDGVKLKFNVGSCINITILSVKVKEVLASFINGHCNETIENIAKCCQIADPSTIPAIAGIGDNSYGLTAGDLQSEDNFPKGSCKSNALTFEDLIVVKAQKQATLCTWAKPSSRRRRYITFGGSDSALNLDDILVKFNDPTTLADLVTTLQATFPNVTFDVVILAAKDAYTTVPPSTTAASTTVGTPSSSGLLDWHIALIIIGALLLVVIIIVIIVVVMKKSSSKVSDSSRNVQSA